MKKIILGSASPRRKELLSQIGVPFEVRVSNKEEVYTNTVPKEIVKRAGADESGKCGIRDPGKECDRDRCGYDRCA